MEMPNCIYNMDETGMPLDHKQLKRIALKGIKKVHGSSSGNKMQITVISCANTAGTMLPLMVVFKGERLNHECTRGEEKSLVQYMECPPKIGQIMSFSWSG